MSKQSLATKYRPTGWDAVVEQDAVKEILKTQVETETFQNAYLFCGPAGTGKTTCARIFASEINRGQGSVIEVDAASNSGVDNIRKIIDDSKRRALDGEYKIYLLDEVHMLSTGAWNALLKLLEEPPKYTIFLMCTTDPQKIPATIMSRIQRFQLSKISTQSIYDRLCYICQQEEIQEDESSLEFIAKIAQGGMRDAITNLDKCVSSGNPLTLENVVKALGNVEYETQLELFDCLYNNDVEKCVEIVETLFNSGKSLKLFIQQFQSFLVDICKYLIFNSFKYSQIPALPIYQEQISKYDKKRAVEILDLIKDLNYALKWETDVRYAVETALLTMGN